MITRSKGNHQSHLTLTNSVPSISTNEPTGYRIALTLPHWKVAMDEDINALKENDTWTLVKQPPNTNVIGSK